MNKIPASKRSAKHLVVGNIFHGGLHKDWFGPSKA